MKKLVKFSLTALAAVTLVACSSGGSSSNNAARGTSQTGTSQTGTSQTETSQTETSQTETSQTGTSQTGTSQTGTSQTGTSQTGASQAGNQQQGGRGQRPPMASGSSQHTNDKGGFFYDGMRRSFPNAIATDFGVVLPVLDSSTSGFSEHAQRLGKLYISDPKFSSYFGYFAAGGHSTIFYQGSNLTAESEIPQSGTAKYVGDSIYVNKGKVTTQVGKVDLTVDFANRNVTGTVFAQQDGIAAVTIKDATLDKNAFSGTVVQAGNEAQLHGKFYGKDAAELSGAYSDNQGEAGLKGAFGAKKQ